MTKEEFTTVCIEINFYIKRLLPICDAITEAVCEFYEGKGEYDSLEEDQMLIHFRNLMMPQSKAVSNLWFGHTIIDNIPIRLEKFKGFMEQCYENELYLQF